MKILTVQDISCYGQCSITVALPILSSYGIETVILPSSVLSTHTSGFKNFTIHDLTLEMPRIINHWKDENIKFDSIYTGYIGDTRQFDYILDIKDKLLNKDGLFFVDPAMADNGKLYPALNLDIVSGMRKISSVADYIIPNITEACFLLGIKYKDHFTTEEIYEIIDKLHKLGPKNIILTGYIDNGYIYNFTFDGNKKEIIKRKLISKSYHGTGDIFSSVLIASILNGNNIVKASNDAADFVIDSINETINDNSHNYGVKFEKVLFKKHN